MQHITDLKLRERMFLLNDLLGTHVSEFFFLHPFIVSTYVRPLNEVAKSFSRL